MLAAFSVKVILLVHRAQYFNIQTFCVSLEKFETASVLLTGVTTPNAIPKVIPLKMLILGLKTF